MRGWRRRIEASEIRHAFKRHGPGSKKWASGDKFSLRDLRQIGKLTNGKPYSVLRKKGGDLRIGYRAEIGGRTYTYYETASKTRQAVLFKTMFRKG